MEWQYIGKGMWCFGKITRGVVREPLAFVFYDSGSYTFDVPKTADRGYFCTLNNAIGQAEESLKKLGYEFPND